VIGHTFTTRVWLTLLMHAAARAGLTPFPKARFHRLVFLSNCLAPLFEATPNSAHIVKYKHGPFYPRVQHELDRLATMGIFEISDVHYTHGKDGWWLDAHYGLGHAAKSVIEYVHRVEYGRRLGEYLDEVATGFATVKRDALDDLALNDENYARPGAGEYGFIDFSERERNFSLKTAEDFRTVLPKGLVPTQKEEVFLYMRFLEALGNKQAV
jgi:hypothetical protein